MDASIKQMMGALSGGLVAHEGRLGSEHPKVKETAALMAQLIEFAESCPDAGAFWDKGMAAFVVFLTDDPDAMETKLVAFAKKHKIKNIPLTIVEGKAGPPKYKVAKDAEVTVMMWKGLKVRSNHAFRKGELNKASVKKVLAGTKVVLSEKSDKK